MQKFEYATLVVDSARFLSKPQIDHETFHDSLNKYGADGWELVSIFTLARNQGDTHEATAVFKRFRFIIFRLSLFDPSLLTLPPMTGRGKFVLTLLILAIAGVGAYKWLHKVQPDAAANSTTSSSSHLRQQLRLETPPTKAALDPADFIEPLTSCPLLPPAGTYVAKDNTLDIELSEYAGYSGIVVANGGLEPSENSYFFRKHGFKVRIKLSEEESWPALNTGRLAASATTVDVLAAHCRNFQVVAPVQIGFSRGADGLVVRKEIRRINDLKGRTLVTAQFTEADFFLRYLTQEAGIPINVLSGPNDRPAPDKVNLLFAADAFAAGDIFLKDLQSGGNRLAGCITWAPKTTEVVDASNGAALILATNQNLLIVADILVVNKGFAAANPAQVAGLVDGVLEGNRLVRDNPSAHLDLIGKTFKWDKAQTQAELAKVHFSNLPENLAFYSGAIDSAGSFSGIYSSAILAYGSLIDKPVDAERYMAPQHLEALKAAGAFAGQQITLAPIRSSAARRPRTRSASQPKTSVSSLSPTPRNSTSRARKTKPTSSPSAASCRSAPARRFSSAATWTTPSSINSASKAATPSYARWRSRRWSFPRVAPAKFAASSSKTSKSPPPASKPSAAAGKNPPAPTPRKTAASKSSGSPSSDKTALHI
ncbi:MAG: DUF4177 domain-containing protein [Myxococcales bacterium]